MKSDERSTDVPSNMECFLRLSIARREGMRRERGDARPAGSGNSLRERGDGGVRDACDELGLEWRDAVLHDARLGDAGLELAPDLAGFEEAEM